MSKQQDTSKLWGGRFNEPTDSFVQRFTASVDFDQRMAMETARRIEAGLVWVNGSGRKPLGVPFGGYKDSGIGREGSRYGIDEYLEIKYLCMGGIDR